MNLQKITLATSNLPAMYAFYHQLLGFPVVEMSDARVSFQIGRSELCFEKSKVPAFYHLAFLIPANQIAEAHQWLAEKTSVLPFDEHGPFADFKNWHAKAFYFHDEGQNILELIAHHDLENKSEKPFTVDSVLSICEIGIPVQSVTDACAYFHHRYAIPYFDKGPRLSHFAAMGDAEGLLIVTTIGRGWLPTQRPAEQHPLQIQLAHNGTTILLTDRDFQY